MKLFTSALLLLVTVALFAKEGEKPKKSPAQEEADTKKQIAVIEKSLTYSKGNIVIADNKITLNVPAGFKFLEKVQAKKVVEEYWGNPPQPNILGLIMPESGKVLSDDSYAFILTYEEDGYVKDKDAEKINYDDLMKGIKESEPEENKQRKAQGYNALSTVGWAQKPFYDKSKKILHWAKELHVEGAEANTLNYDVRVLGRKGVLSMNAVGSMAMLDSVKKDIDNVIQIASFNDGFKYEQFDDKTDNVAAYTIGGLVGAKVLAKVGILAKFGKFLAVAWKFILIGLVAGWGFIKKLFTKKKEETYEYEPSTNTTYEQEEVIEQTPKQIDTDLDNKIDDKPNS
jgi:uncharacterized membrane-anchored protein